MMDKEKCLRTIEETGVVAVIRVNNADELMDTTVALSEGGVKALEITMTSPGALDTIAQASARFGETPLLESEACSMPKQRAWQFAGAKFVVSPVLKEEIVRMCKRYSVACIPGAYTPTEILAAWEAGGDVIKVFPATKLGPSYFKDIHGPMPQIKLTPTGGVDLNTAGEFIKAGACFVGVGGAWSIRS